MLTFSPQSPGHKSRTSSTSSDKPSLEGTSAGPSLDQLINNFLGQITQLPNFEVLRHRMEQDILHEQLKSTILSEVQEAPKKIEEIHNEFTKGKYDKFILSDTPILTIELMIILSSYNREFIQYLFTNCESDKCLRFWLDKPEVKLPEDTWALAVSLGNNIFVLKYLKEKGWFDKLTDSDKEQLLERGQKFQGEGLEYLKTEFSKKSPKLE